MGKEYTITEQKLIIELVKSLNKGNSGYAVDRVAVAARQIEQLRESLDVERIH